MNIADVIMPQQLLADHLDKTPFALIAWDREMRILSWSHQAEVLFGWKEEEVKGKHFTDFPFVYDDDLELVRRNIAPLLKGEIDRFTDSNRNLRKDGSVVHCIWYGYVVKDAAGEVLSFFSLVQDVTDKARQDAALKEANERLSLLTTATTDGIWEWDQEQNTVWANETYQKTFGYNPSDYADFYTEWLTRLHPDDREPFLSSIYAARERKEKTWSGEFRFRIANGSYGVILQKVHFIYGPDGEVKRSVGVDIDVTNLRRTEAALRLSEEKFSRAFRSSPVPINILRLKDNTFSDVNDAYCRLIGYTKEELIGKPYRQFRIISEQSAQEAILILQKQGHLYNHRLEMMRKDGSAVYSLISADVLMIDEEQYLLTTLFDITEQLKAEEALRLNEQQLELVYNTISDVVYLLEVVGEEQYRFITVNEAFLKATGLKLEDVQGRSVQEVIPEPSLSLVLAKYRQAIDCRTKIQWEEVTAYPAGTKTGIVSIIPVFEDRQATRLVGTVHDITEQKKAAEELSRSYQEIRLLASHLQDVREEERANIAREIHDELGQLLTALKMEVSWLKKIDTLSAGQVARRVSSVNALLDGAINTVRTISAELRPSILDDIGLGEAMAWQAREFEKRYGIKVKLNAHISEVELPREVATAFFRIFQETLTNVARHARARQVTADLSLAGKNLVLQVKDDGVGFEQEKIAAQKTLGLMGIKERLAAINGQFHLQTAPGQGTTITISAPYVSLTT